MIVDGWHGDTSRMYLVGDVKLQSRSAWSTSPMNAMMRGIAAVKPGATTGDIGHAIQSYRRRRRSAAPWCAISAAMAWARVFHALPNIVHYGKPGHGIALKPGMFFTIEPMINLGGYGVKVLNDGWTAVTRDRSLSAQFEHSVGVTENGRRDLHALAQGLGQAALWVNLRT